MGPVCPPDPLLYSIMIGAMRWVQLIELKTKSFLCRKLSVCTWNGEFLCLAVSQICASVLYTYTLPIRLRDVSVLSLNCGEAEFYLEISSPPAEPGAVLPNCPAQRNGNGPTGCCIMVLQPWDHPNRMDFILTGLVKYRKQSRKTRREQKVTAINATRTKPDTKMPWAFVFNAENNFLHFALK